MEIRQASVARGGYLVDDGLGVCGDGCHGKLRAWHEKLGTRKEMLHRKTFASVLCLRSPSLRNRKVIVCVTQTAEDPGSDLVRTEQA